MHPKDLLGKNSFSSTYTEEELSSLANSISEFPRAVSLEEIFQDENDCMQTKLLDYLKSDPRFIVIEPTPGNRFPRILPRKIVITNFIWVNLRLAQVGEEFLPTSFVIKGILKNFTKPLSKEDSRNILKFLAKYNLIELGKDSYIYFPLADIYSEFYSQIGESLFDVFFEFVENYSVNANKFDIEINKCFVVFPEKGKFKIHRKRNQKIVRLRYGLEGKRERTLEEIGNRLALTRERVRQVLDFFEKRIKCSRTYKKYLISAFLWALKNSKRKRIFCIDDKAVYLRVKMVSDLLNLKFNKIDRFSIRYLATNKKKSRDFENYLSQVCDIVDIQDISENLYSNKGFFLGEKDRELLIKILFDRKKKSLKYTYWVERALEEIGRPAHYTEIAEYCCSQFSEVELTPKQVLTVLNRRDKKELPWVWTGKKGYYALKKWGFKKPEEDLYTSVVIIVKEIYQKTKKPIHINRIKRELLNRGRLFAEGSLYFACYKNPRIKQTYTGYFIPKKIDEVDEKDNRDSILNLDKLDKAISSIDFFSEEKDRE